MNQLLRQVVSYAQSLGSWSYPITKTNRVIPVESVCLHCKSIFLGIRISRLSPW